MRRCAALATATSRPGAWRRSRPTTAIHYPGTYVAGVYNRLVDAVDGHQLDHESLVNLPNWVLFEFRTEDGAWFSMDRTEVLDHTLTLDMRQVS